MKTKKIIATAVGAFVMASLVWLALDRMRPKPPEPPPTVDLPEALVVFCFHDNQQSVECEKMEQFMHELLEKSFAAELKEGLIRWRVVNFEDPEDPENARLVEEYHIAAPSIVVVDGRPGNSNVAVDYQQKALKLVGDKEAFKKYFRGEIEKALK